MLVDRFGAARLTLWTSVVSALGAALTAWGPDFATMAAGRLLFGVGAETFSVATMAAIAQYFSGRQVAFALGLSLGVGRLGSYSADMSPTWFAGAYQAGWQPPLTIATILAVVALAAALAYWWIDRPIRAAHSRGAGAPGMGVPASGAPAADAARRGSGCVTCSASAPPTGTCSRSACSGTRRSSRSAARLRSSISSTPTASTWQPPAR